MRSAFRSSYSVPALLFNLANGEVGQLPTLLKIVMTHLVSTRATRALLAPAVAVRHGVQ
jgi:hypothetical protein